MFTGLLSIQRKLLRIAIITGVLFVLFDIIALIRFNFIFNISVREAVEYSRENFMLPNVPFDIYSSKGKDFRIYEPGVIQTPLQRGESPIYARWDWYLDEVFLSGITFLTSLFFLLISLIMKKIIEETKKE